ncbi:MAG: extracellular solute-binding protein [Firmicutes bacterium]|nr:extracellular solute-binding protein [Bacillota bacterium]
MRYILVFIVVIALSWALLGRPGTEEVTPVGESGETIYVLGVVGIHELIVDSLAKKLAAAHIKVEKNFFYWDTYLAKARLALMNDTREYDVILGPYSQLAPFIKNNKTVALKDVAKRAGLKPEDLYQSIREKMIDGGNFYCLPYVTDTLIYFYRKDLFQKAGLRPPRTITEMYETGKTMTSGSDYGLAFPAGPGEGVTAVWSYFLWSYGGDFFDTGWRPMLNSSRALTATRIYNQILLECAPPAVATWQTEEAANFFAQGHLAAMILWSGAWRILDDGGQNKIAGKIGYALLPAGDSGQAAPCLEVWVAVAPRTSPHILAAKKFCELLASREAFEKTAELGLAPTPLAGLNARYADKRPMTPFAVATRALAMARERPIVPEATQFIPVISSGLNDILMGAGLKVTMDAINQQITGIMQLNGRYKKN